MNELSHKDFTFFRQAADVLEQLNIDFVVFGGIAVWAYGRQRATKDIDFLIYPKDADRALVALLKSGWTTKRTDGTWLFQASKNGVQVDLIFAAKGEFALDEDILNRANIIQIMGHEFKVVSAEDLIMIKIHALKETRPADWYDAISVLNGINGDLDWNYLIKKSRRYPKRILSFFLFAQTEIEASYIPDWFISQLMDVALACKRAA
ncbi:MAG: hypothetical protein C4562_02940 [Actinobacteria bacterium]|nr:MAG: hypothetical protein C4562_02940 [Actinomycetota bacterium]